MGRGVIFGEDAGAVVGGEDEDGIDRKEGHVGRHCSGGESDAEGEGWRRRREEPKGGVGFLVTVG